MTTAVAAPVPIRGLPGADAPVVVSLFSGDGGLDLGLELAGWRISAQVEMDAQCAGTLEGHNSSRDAPVPV